MVGAGLSYPLKKSRFTKEKKNKYHEFLLPFLITRHKKKKFNLPAMLENINCF